MVDQTSPKEFDSKIREAADELIAQHGSEVENATTEKMIQVLDEGSMDEVIHWLKVRQCVRQKSGKDRYVRRLPDKMLWAVEQALEQGRDQLARVLGGIYSEAKADDDRVKRDRRK
ncbi:MAG: hypothetical protein HOA08_18670 [Rhodospirillaceae bacterium]|jgi:hypothetical protein|nr:hypothetical protein [Rhodospirillaceae bacterium]MBT3491534.1 hypothetical protein [Rhodospirillaceae bacterium]MBT3778447.1 hypothetical protein [Rhodospirillaceae bacterium]MBT3976072.1 hypothetical protein [Rhodospirillaceae bacterium]MBT4171012.1 hypothetical protein [Rhodospirillaceae bacterium]